MLCGSSTMTGEIGEVLNRLDRMAIEVANFNV